MAVSMSKLYPEHLISKGSSKRAIVSTETANISLYVRFLIPCNVIFDLDHRTQATCNIV